jgi:hypothetical protein
MCLTACRPEAQSREPVNKDKNHPVLYHNSARVLCYIWFIYLQLQFVCITVTSFSSLNDWQAVGNTLRRSTLLKPNILDIIGGTTRIELGSIPATWLERAGRSGFRWTRRNSFLFRVTEHWVELAVSIYYESEVSVDWGTQENSFCHLKMEIEPISKT